MKITINRETLLTKFISPVSKISQRCVISLFPTHIQSLVTTAEGNPILYAKVDTKCDLGGKDEVTLNIGDLNKLARILNCLTSETIELEINSNSIEYKSPNMAFKYHLLEDGVIEKAPCRLDKIQAIKFNTRFTIDRDRASALLRAAAFSTDSNKMYFYTKDGNVYAELTDREMANTDSVCHFITDEYSDDEIKKPILIDVETFKMFSGLKQNIFVKVNTENRIIMFKFEDTDYTLQYIVASASK